MADEGALEFRIKNLEEQFEKSSRKHQEFYDRIGKLEKNQIEIQANYHYIEQKLDEISEKVDRLVNAPGDNWNTLMKNIITAISGGIIGFVISKIFN